MVFLSSGSSLDAICTAGKVTGQLLSKHSSSARAGIQLCDLKISDADAGNMAVAGDSVDEQAEAVEDVEHVEAQLYLVVLDGVAHVEGVVLQRVLCLHLLHRLLILCLLCSRDFALSMLPDDTHSLQGASFQEYTRRGRGGIGM